MIKTVILYTFSMISPISFRRNHCDYAQFPEATVVYIRHLVVTLQRKDCPGHIVFYGRIDFRCGLRLCEVRAPHQQS